MLTTPAWTWFAVATGLCAGCGRVGFGFDPDAGVSPDAVIDDAADGFIPACTVGACPAGFTAVDGGCYQLVLAPTKWLFAEQACEAVGAHLVVEDTINEHFTIHTLATGVPQVWIGWTDRVGPDNTFTWVVPAGGELMQAGNCVFPSGEPDAGDLDHCVAQDGANTCGDYVDVDCDLMLPYVCECDGVLADRTRY